MAGEVRRKGEVGRKRNNKNGVALPVLRGALKSMHLLKVNWPTLIDEDTWRGPFSLWSEHMEVIDRALMDVWVIVGDLFGGQVTVLPSSRKSALG